jgi:hypothetical protein
LPGGNRLFSHPKPLVSGLAVVDLSGTQTVFGPSFRAAEKNYVFFTKSCKKALSIFEKMGYNRSNTMFTEEEGHAKERVCDTKG